MAAVAGQAELLEETRAYEFNSVLDIGFGCGEASRFFLDQGKDVTATGYDVSGYEVDPLVLERARIVENIPAEDMSIFPDESFDAVWCSHIIEHSRNPGLVFDEIYRVLKPGGVLFVMVPPYCIPVSGGHISIGWTIGTMIYNLILAGFDTKHGSYVRHKHNIVGFVHKGDRSKLPSLRYDIGDIETLQDFFPMDAYQNFPGDIMNCNWEWQYYVPSFNDRKKIFWHYTKWRVRSFLMNHIF